MSEVSSARAIDRLVREEHRSLVSWLVGRLGSHQLPLAEDMAQEAMVEALSRWPWQGTPDNPGAWLRTVARNRAIDGLRRAQKESEWLPDQEADPDARTDDVFAARVPDEELRLVFLCCHPQLAELDQLALTLKVAGGFTARETAAVLLRPETAVAQRLARAKRTLRESGDHLAEEPTPFDIRTRLDTALKVIHLAFSHGYAPRSGDHLVRQDLCRWALRLSGELTGGTLTSTGGAHALHALLCFQSSRLGAREAADGSPILLRHQDRGAWDRTLIEQGLSSLGAARKGTVSRYHLEAGIASLHATAETWTATDWATMVGLYERLERLTGAPVVTVNAAVARAEAGDVDKALETLDAVGDAPGMSRYAPFHVARADLLRRLGRDSEAKEEIDRARACGLSAPAAAFLGSG